MSATARSGLAVGGTTPNASWHERLLQMNSPSTSELVDLLGSKDSHLKAFGPKDQVKQGTEIPE